MARPDVFTLRKRSFEVVERKVLPKEIAVYPDPEETGTLVTSLPPEKMRAPCLTDAAAREVARLACRAEEQFGAAQEIEWGLAGDDLFILQSRPIQGR
jgi:pyruvate,water dikinase